MASALPYIFIEGKMLKRILGYVEICTECIKNVIKKGEVFT